MLQQSMQSTGNSRHFNVRMVKAKKEIDMSVGTRKPKGPRKGGKKGK